MDGPQQRLRAVASAQNGQFASAQALGVGLTFGVVRSLRDRGETIGMRRGVWRFRAAQGDPDMAVTAYLACWPHGVVSHASAAGHHGLQRVGAPLLPVITIPHGKTRRPKGVTVHHSRALAPCDVLTVGGVRYTSLARTVCDLSSGDDVWETLALLDDAVALGARPTWIQQRAVALAAGRDGVALLRAATRPDAAAEFRSWLERAAAHVYQVSGIPDPEWNVLVRDGAGVIGRVDALWPPWSVISEKEGLRFHTGPRQRRKDAQRFNRLADAGYAARRFGWEDVVSAPSDMAATVVRALRAAGADLDPARIPERIVLPGRPFA
ncbi:MAG: hypothetical protein H0V05_08095 [Euzebyaceae bacterium]|jgi:hypothetical protein|nr:hypothetical protein [Euzebyaceae bacterium]